MGAEVDAALWNVEVAFIAHTPRMTGRADPHPIAPGPVGTADPALDPDVVPDPGVVPDPDPDPDLVLDSTLDLVLDPALDLALGPHGPDVVRGRADDADARAWVLALGVSMGGPEDVRALTPWLLAEAVRGDRVDLRTVLARIAGCWGDWTPAETGAVRTVVDALWCDVLDAHPGPESTPTAVDFLDAAGGLGDPPDRLLAIWEWREIPSADHHLAELVVDAFYGARVGPVVLAWAVDAPQRDRLRRALARDAGSPWVGDLAAAVDLLPT